MRKMFFSLMIAMPAFVSCLIDDADVDPVNAQKLKAYAIDMLVETVALPLEAAELALEFDDFLKLPEAEMLEDTVFRDHYSEIEDGVYRIVLKSRNEDREYYCQVSTGGRSIRESGAVWVFDTFVICGDDPGYSRINYKFEMPAGTEMVMMSPSDSTWTMTAGDNVLDMKQHPKLGQLYRWSVDAQGSEDTSLDIVSQCRTGKGFQVYERLLDSGEKSNSYHGQFFVDISRDGDPLDYCYISFLPDVSATYRLSR